MPAGHIQNNSKNTDYHSNDDNDDDDFKSEPKHADREDCIKIKILGSCLFLQSVLANLHASRPHTRQQSH